MAQYIQKQCEKSGWVNLHECSDPSAVGVVVKIGDGHHAREPTTIDPSVIKTVQFMNAAIAFTMASVVTSAIFRQITPTQKELVVKSRGTSFPIVDSFEDLISSVNMHGLTGTAYLLRGPQLVLVWSTSVEDILMRGATVDELLCQAVSVDAQLLQKVANPSRYQIQIQHLLLFTTMLVSRARLVFHPSAPAPDEILLLKSPRAGSLHHVRHISTLQQRSRNKILRPTTSNLQQSHPH
jgi:hypothetical protein